jgi:hypothetical protein
MAVRLLTLALLARAATGQVINCPKDGDQYAVSSNKGGAAQVLMTNDADMDISIWWVDFQGNEVYRGVQGAGYDRRAPFGSFLGHVFRIRSLIDDRILMDYMVDGDTSNHPVGDCGYNDPAAQMNQTRWPEFDALVGQDSPCVGENSGSWSCVKWVSPEEIASRNKLDYGFHEGDDTPRGRTAHEQVDTGYTSQQPYITNVTEYDGGFLKMQMTQKMKDILYPWYEERLEDSVELHDIIAGGYTNSHKVRMSKIDLDKFPEVKARCCAPRTTPPSLGIAFSLSLSLFLSLSFSLAHALCAISFCYAPTLPRMPTYGMSTYVSPPIHAISLADPQGAHQGDGPGAAVVVQDEAPSHLHGTNHAPSHAPLMHPLMHPLTHPRMHPLMQFGLRLYHRGSTLIDHLDIAR